MKKLDLLAFGAHPDDVEIGMGGTLAKYSELGFKVGICDLTHAELSSNGTVEGRQQEAQRASRILGLETRIQLNFRDRGLKYITEEQMRELVSVIRYHQPKLVFAPYAVDRHPDHGQCAELVKEALFNAGIRNYTCRDRLAPHRVRDYHYYFINGYERPDFLVDITKQFVKKKQALAAYKSQFVFKEGSIRTPLTNGYLELVEARERLFGKEAGIDFAEGFKTTKPLLLNTLMEEDVLADETTYRD